MVFQTKLMKARREAAQEIIDETIAKGVAFYPGKIMAAYMAGYFDKSEAVQRRLK